MSPVWVLQHLEAEPPGLIGEALTDAGFAVHVLRPDLDPPPPIPPDVQGLVVMGGPMAVYQSQQHPWMAAELACLREALARGLPVLGMCLGAQLLAAAAGGQALPGAAGPEFGWAPVRFTEAGAADPLGAALLGAPGAAEALVFHWHGDTFTLPPGATLLAGSAAYPHQAFRLGLRAYGFQFHFEVDAATIEGWLALWGQDAEQAGCPVAAIRAETRRHLPGLGRRGAAAAREFARLVREYRAPTVARTGSG